MKAFFSFLFSVRMLIIVLVVGTVAAGGYYVYYVETANAAGPGFRTEPVARHNLTATITATGTIEPEEVIDVGAQVQGRVLRFGKVKDPVDPSVEHDVDYCTPVKAGTVLAEIDPTIYQSHVDQAQAALKNAEANAHQAQAHVNSQRDIVVRDERSPGATPEATLVLDQANYEEAQAALGVSEAAIQQAQANLKEAQTNLDYCTIKSPVDGVVVDRRVNVGQTVVASLSAPSLFLLAKDLTRLQVWVSVNEADIGNIHIGQDVTFTVDARPGERFKGTVQQIRYNATMTQNVVTYTVVVSTTNKVLDNPAPVQVRTPSGGTTTTTQELELLPYLTANLTFHVAERTNALLAPNSALRWRPQLAQVAPEYRDAYEQSLRKRATKESNPDEPAPANPDKGSGKKQGGAANHGNVWVQDGIYVRPIKVLTGLTDGAMTEIVKVLGDDKLEEGTALVSGENQAQAGAATTNPFQMKIFAPKPKKQDQ